MNRNIKMKSSLKTAIIMSICFIVVIVTVVMMVDNPYIVTMFPANYSLGLVRFIAILIMAIPALAIIWGVGYNIASLGDNWGSKDKGK